jgi:hypothetical protein
MLKGSWRSAEFRDAKNVARRVCGPATRSQNVFAMVDLPVPAKPANQKIDMLGDRSLAQDSIFSSTSVRVFSRQPEGDERES